MGLRLRLYTMKLPKDISPSNLYAAWWKECGERQFRLTGYTTYKKHPDYTFSQAHKMRCIEQEEFISLIEQLTRRIQSL